MLMQRVRIKATENPLHPTDSNPTKANRNNSLEM